MKDGSLYVQISGVSSTKTQFDSGTEFQFSVSNISNPMSLQPSQSYQIYVTSSMYSPYYKNQMVVGLNLTNLYPGNLTNI